MLKNTTSTFITTYIFFNFAVGCCISLCQADHVVAQSFPAPNSISIDDLKSEVKKAAESQDKEESIIIDEVNSEMKTRSKARFPKSTFPYYEPPDGCSAPDGWKFKRWNIVFESACNNHDICYTTPGNTKEHCDHQMLRDMLAICGSVSNTSSRTACESAAEGYYDGLDMNPLWFVSRAYNIAQEQEKEYIKSVYAWLTKRWPGKYIGSWKGSGVQASGGWSIAITLKPGEKNSVVGTIDYPSIPCSGELTLRYFDNKIVRLSESLTNVGTCVNGGTVVLKLDERDQLQYEWLYSNGVVAATGSLQRVK